jgi:8-oxo-dGTP pyrophosphatase MutT (NUDIX family)
VRRSTQSVFVPDRYVFPGGALDPEDSSPAALARLTGITPAQAEIALRDTLGLGADDAVLPITSAQKAGLYLAALRELFEEAGILLVQDEQGLEIEIGREIACHSHFHAARLAMQQKQLTFLGLLEREKLQADAGRLIYFSHWITPASEQHRFDTRFFVARVAFGHKAEADKYETTEGVWIEPAKALELHAQKRFSMIYPTIAHLRRLASLTTLSALLQYARSKEIVPAMPDTLDGSTFRLPEPLGERW